jgi:hypothetical protein
MLVSVVASHSAWDLVVPAVAVVFVVCASAAIWGWPIKDQVHHHWYWQGLLRPAKGTDSRVSTSKMVAWAWFLITIWMLGAVIAISLHFSDPSSYLTAAQGPLAQYETYLLLMGGPFAALVLSKLIAQQGGDLRSMGPPDLTLTDVFANDNGDADVYDTQYTLFNVLAMVCVVAVFVKAPALGLPKLPDQLAILTGGPAGVYLARKALSLQGALSITGVSATAAYSGSDVWVYGSGFLAGAKSVAEPSLWPTVLLCGQSADIVDSPSDTAVHVVVPLLPEAKDYAIGQPVEVIAQAVTPVHAASTQNFAVLDPATQPVSVSAVSATAACSESDVWVYGSGFLAGAKSAQPEPFWPSVMLAGQSARVLESPTDTALHVAVPQLEDPSGYGQSKPVVVIAKCVTPVRSSETQLFAVLGPASKPPCTLSTAALQQPPAVGTDPAQPVAAKTPAMGGAAGANRTAGQAGRAHRTRQSAKQPQSSPVLAADGGNGHAGTDPSSREQSPSGTLADVAVDGLPLGKHSL